MLIDPYIPQCGDVGFVGYDPGEFVSDNIGKLTTGLRESPTVAHHQFQVLRMERCFEALMKAGVVVRSLEERFAACKTDRSHYIIFRPPMDVSKMNAIEKRAFELEGSRYGRIEIALQAIDGVLRKAGLLPEGVPLFTLLGALVPWTAICSGASNQCLYAGGVLPKRFLYLSPDGTYDEAIRLGWRVVAMDKNGASYWNEAQIQGEGE